MIHIYIVSLQNIDKIKIKTLCYVIAQAIKKY